MNYHDSLLNLFETYVRESDKFEKGNKSAAAQEQEKLTEISKICTMRRKEIQEKNA